ncbi:uncharacterized protein N7515_007288 [Penicillium bovifimosum]|uniref:G-patch domain-containing protein n=1 Tax=Penicillium bovifimosum TaxID=126998 RepID=A0A9W9GWC5_9EURO|nr:uncharacterized protein N7515_007288 [Penicillium bovifimosum]KAJ5131249.1 hypothetical protein N7515_007288 [Penicillium bovifimosum]
MDAQAYLIKHGWSGPGNPLNPNPRPGAHGGLGLTRPLLVSRKANNHGVGKKTTKDPTNQWWLRGFEDALKGIGNDSFEATSARESNALTSELYRHFVRGEGLAGTLDGVKKEATVSASTSTATTSKSKRKREDGEEKSDRKARKLEKAKRKEEKAKRKEERRLKRVAKVERREKKIAERIAKKAKKELVRTAEEDYPTPMSIGQESAETTETDEAAARSKEKAAKKEKKESRKAKSAESEVDVEDPKKKSKKEMKDKKAKA